MTTNIEKLCEEINVLFIEEPGIMNCVGAQVSTHVGQQRIYFNCLWENLIPCIQFQETLPFDPAGTPGTTDDVLAGAYIRIFWEPDPEQPDEDLKKNIQSTYDHIFYTLHLEARAGHISSKSWAAEQLDPSILAERDRQQKQAIDLSTQLHQEFLAEQDPATRRALSSLYEETKAAQEKKKNEARKRRKK